MNAHTKTDSLPRKTKASSIEAVKFKDGMIVTAEDLQAAMQYPVAMFQALVRAYFGCGIVCGLELKPERGAGEKDDCDDGKGRKDARTFVVCINKGVALDCHGFPLELCGPIKLDLTPDPCSCEPPPKEVCIAIKRITSDEAPRDVCGCHTDEPRFQCSRVRDHVLVQAFLPDDEPHNLCKRSPRKEEQAKYPMQTVCECLKTCPDCDCCGDAWVLLGCVRLDENGIATDMDERKYVKPIECLCRPFEEQQQPKDETPYDRAPPEENRPDEERPQPEKPADKADYDKKEEPETYEKEEPKTPSSRGRKKK
jgi:hypothetical protein